MKILLYHPWTKETVELEAETITDTFVAVKWGLNGTYDLNLKSNVLTARSLKAQRRGKPLWMALNIQSIRKEVAEYLKAERDKREKYRVLSDEDMKKHAESMPK